MKLTKIHNQIRYAFMKLNYSPQTEGVIWSVFNDICGSKWTIRQFTKAFDELVRWRYIGKQQLYWCCIKPKRQKGLNAADARKVE